ncbi:sulfate transport system permease protein CysW [archaeon]|nr:sulfate transport system permease protein CysW [archaeon]
MKLFAAIYTIAGVIVAVFIFFPIVSVVINAFHAPPALLLSHDTVAAIKLSLITATVSTLIIFILGTPLAYYLARNNSAFSRALDLLLGLEMVLPPAVAGIALLAAFGRTGILGRYLAVFGITLPFTTAAVVIAQTFVALPLYVNPVRAGYASINRNLEGAAFTLGASELYTFLKISFPLARNATLAGAIMSWSRAMGEFGATIMFAGNFVGRTQTMPLAVYSALQVSFNKAMVVAAVLILISFVILIAFGAISKRNSKRSDLNA